MKITKIFTFEAAHRLQSHEGKCRNLHGHSYKVEATVEGDQIEEGPAAGMVLDFDKLKAWWRTNEPLLDHKTILQDTDPLTSGLGKLIGVDLTLLHWPPTAENFARWLCQDLQGYLADVQEREGSKGAPRSAAVTVWETATSYASFETEF